MKTINFACKLTAMISVVFVSVLPISAQGERQKLNGSYSFTGEQACLVSPLGFTPLLTPISANSSVQSASTHGIIKFNADGTGTADFKELLIVHPPATPVAASVQKASFSFTYTIAEDGALTFVIGTVTGTFVAGPFTGLTFTNNPPPMVGRVARNGSAITLTTVDPAVEISILGPPANVSMPRICHRSRVLVPIHLDDGD